MALDQEQFSLKNAMARVWTENNHLTDQEKAIIGSLEGIDSIEGPKSEDDLISAQTALGFLTSFRNSLGEEALTSWFTSDALNYPETINKYIIEIAYDLYCYKIPKYKLGLWGTFLDNLVLHIEQTRSHIATLNYDDLLYDPIVSGHTISNTDRCVKLSQ